MRTEQRIEAGPADGTVVEAMQRPPPTRAQLVIVATRPDVVAPGAA